MAPVFKYVSGLLCLATALFPACSSDSPGEPPSQAGSAGKGGTGTAGAGGLAAPGGDAGSDAGGSAGAGGSGVAGSNASGSGGAAGGESDGGAGGAGGSASGAAGAAGAPAAVIGQCLDAPLIDETRTEALHFEAPGLELAIVRRSDPDAFGTSGTTPWLPQRFGFERGADAECLTDVGALTYTVSHHNFDDSLAAQVGDETWLFKQAREEYDVPTSWTIEAHRDETVLWGPVTLTLVSCQRVDVDDSCTDSYL